MYNQITILTIESVTTHDKSEKYKIICSSDKFEQVSQRCNFDSLMDIIDETKPRAITLIADNMHGKNIVLFLSYLISKKYKPFIYNFMFKHELNRARIIMIRFIIL